MSNVQTRIRDLTPVILFLYSVQKPLKCQIIINYMYVCLCQRVLDTILSHDTLVSPPYGLDPVYSPVPFISYPFGTHVRTSPEIDPSIDPLQ